MQAINNKNPLPLEGEADFLLAASVTHTCNIANITQAGIPGKIHLTPTLDAEFISTAKVFSLGDVAETPKGVPTPALITRAVEQICGFKTIKILDLGLEEKPQNCEVLEFGIAPSEDITKKPHGANINVKEIFEKGRDFGSSYTPEGDYIIVGESTPAGTTTALASIVALGYDELRDAFSSSFAAEPNSLKAIVMNHAHNNITVDMDIYERLSHTADNMLIFVAGFVLEASKKHRVVLAGGTQMAAALLIAENLADTLDAELNDSNIFLATTSWVRNDYNSDIVTILEQLYFDVQSFYADFTFSDSNHPALKLYDEGEAKEGVGAGAALCYALSHGVSEKEIIEEVEKFLMV